MADPWEDHAEWWQREFTDGADPEYTEQILPLIEQHLPTSGRMVDVGCGEGQVARLADAGVLGGVMLSGAGPDATQYGPAWGDAHLPLRNDEPTSLLTTDLVGSFLDAARGLQAYQGIKIQTPADATVERRLAMITSIHDVMATA